MHKTVNDIIAKKGSKKISVVTSYDYTMATLCDQVDILLVETVPEWSCLDMKILFL